MNYRNSRKYYGMCQALNLLGGDMKGKRFCTCLFDYFFLADPPSRSSSDVGDLVPMSILTVVLEPHIRLTYSSLLFSCHLPSPNSSSSPLQGQRLSPLQWHNPHSPPFLCKPENSLTAKPQMLEVVQGSRILHRIPKRAVLAPFPF